MWVIGAYVPLALWVRAVHNGKQQTSLCCIQSCFHWADPHVHGLFTVNCVSVCMFMHGERICLVLMFDVGVFCTQVSEKKRAEDNIEV